MDTETETSSKFQKAIGALLVIICAVLLYGLFAGFRANFGQLASFLIDAIPTTTYGEINTIIFVFSIVNGLSTPIMGFLTIKKSNKFVLILGCILVCIGLFGITFLTTVAGLWIFLGFVLPVGSAALSFAVVFSIVAPFIGEKKAAVASGIINCSSALFATFLAPFTAVIIEMFGFTQCMLIYAVIAAALIPIAIIISKICGQATKITKEEKKSIRFGTICKKIFTTPLFYVILSLQLSYAFVSQGLTNHIVQAGLQVGFDSVSSSVVLSYANIAMMIGMLIIGLVIAKLGNRLSIIIIVTAVMLLIDGFLCLDIEQSRLHIVLIVAGCFFGGTFITLCTSMAAKTFEPLYLATTLGILHLLGKSTQGLNFLIGGAIKDTTGDITYVAYFQFGIALALFFVILIFSIIHMNNMKKMKCAGNSEK